MTKMTGRISAATAAAIISVAAVAGGAPDAAAQSNQDLQRRIEALEQQLETLHNVGQELQTLKQELAKTQRQASKAVKQSRAEDNAKIKWHLGGFGSADFTNTNSSSTSDSFGAGEFNPIFLVGYDDFLLWESELEFTTLTDGSTKTELEFANLNLMATDWLTFSAGKFLSPIGDFQQHLHPSWINKLPDRPAGFMEDGGNEPLNHIGAMVRGAFPIGSMTADYAFFVANGPRFGEDAGDGVELEGFGADDNDNKAFGGRIGFSPLPYLTVGVSGMRSKVKGITGSGGAVTQGDYDLEDVDAAFTYGNWDIRGEWIRSHLGSLVTALDDVSAPAATPGTTWHSWYAQVAYRLAGLTDNAIIGNFEPVFRYSQINTSGLVEFKEKNEERWTVGLDYWFRPSLVAKLAFENRDFDQKQNEDVVRLKLGFGF